MSVTAVEKSQTIKKFQQKNNDTGSPEVQIGLLTQRIQDLSGHFKTHVKDHHSRRGLLKMVSQRRKHLDYLKDRHYDRYQKVIAELGIRK